jgi:hypothetical protein
MAEVRALTRDKSMMCIMLDSLDCAAVISAASEKK